MNETTKTEEKNDSATVAEKGTEAAQGASESSSQSPIKKEIERITKPRTEAEKATFTFQQQAKRLKELGLDPLGALGDNPEDDDDSKPLTRGEFKKMQQDQAQKSAIQMADNIQDADERELVKTYLQTRIVPSGNPAEDFKFAVAAVNSLKNSEIAGEATRPRGKARPTGSGSGAPAKHEEHIEPTQEELQAAALAKKTSPKDIEEFVKKARANAKPLE